MTEPRLGAKRRGPNKRDPRKEAIELEDRAMTLWKSAAVMQAEAMSLLVRAQALRDRP